MAGAVRVVGNDNKLAFYDFGLAGLVRVFVLLLGETHLAEVVVERFFDFCHAGDLNIVSEDVAAFRHGSGGLEICGLFRQLGCDKAWDQISWTEQAILRHQMSEILELILRFGHLYLDSNACFILGHIACQKLAWCTLL